MANRLAGERSPYLLQHAHNPVDWYPWGEEAFALARREEKPVFLSVGYSACHWCHVMERESFEDAAVAALLAERFVCVKVDREERPDVDQVYQLAYQAFAQRAGGWPLSAFLTPEREPFFLATYLPPERRYGMPSFREVVLALSDAWKGRREEVLSQARELRSVLERHLSAPSESAPRAPRASELARMTLLLLRRADAQHGGFGKAPKFPNTLGLELLACARACEDHEAAGRHFLLTLDAMARGGMRDHLGGGFARYSTDERWLVPHFEKMLYDNALLLRAYTEGFRLAGEQGEGERAASYESVARSLVGYLEREMLEPSQGVFYSAQDADSEGEEGRFFVWTPAELEAALPAELARVARAAWDVRPEGNFEHGRSVLWTPREDAAVAAELGLSVEDLRAQREAAREALFLAREARPRPALDDKSLAGWNALLLASLADAGAAFEEPRWVELSLRALRAWLAWRSPEGALPHASKKGEPYGYGFLDDYAGLCVAATELLYARPEGWLLEAARSLLDAALARFWDEERGVLYATPSDGEVVLVRPVETHDHAWPCGAGLCADALLRLHTLTGEARYREVAEKLLHSLTEEVSSNPLGAGSLARALDRLARGELTVVLTGPASPEALALEREARAALLPHRTLLRVTDEAHGRSLGVDPSLYEGRCTEAPTAWVCRGSECLLPARDPATLRAQLRSARRG